MIFSSLHQEAFRNCLDYFREEIREHGTADTQLLKIHAHAMCLILKDKESIADLLGAVKNLALDSIPVDLRLVVIQAMCHTGELEHAEKVLQYYQNVLILLPGQSDEKTCALTSLL